MPDGDLEHIFARKSLLVTVGFQRYAPQGTDFSFPFVRAIQKREAGCLPAKPKLSACSQWSWTLKSSAQDWHPTAENK